MLWVIFWSRRCLVGESVALNGSQVHCMTTPPVIYTYICILYESRGAHLYQRYVWFLLCKGRSNLPLNVHNMKVLTWMYSITNVYDTCISNSVCISYANSARAYICMCSCRLATMSVGLTLVILVKIITNTPPDRHSVGLSFIMWYLVWNRTHPSLVTVIS